MAANLLRALRVLALGAFHLLAHRLQALSRAPGLPGPQRLRLFLEQVGGTYLKLGQVLALQPDILPIEYCNALFDLLDRVPPFAYRDVEQTFIEDLGKTPAELFDHLDEQPMASASIGQVHVARLDGRSLAVKVRRPDVERRFGADLRLMTAVARLIELSRTQRLAWLARAIRELTGWTWEELDYRVEARFMAALAHNARSNPREAVPEVVPELSTSRILVAELLEGPMVLDYIRSLEGRDPALQERLKASGFDPTVFASNIVRNFVWDAFQHGLFHADLHPANLLILPDNVVGYVDFGITGSLSRHSRRSIVAMTLALSRADAQELEEHFFRIATTERTDGEESFRRELAHAIDRWFAPAGDRVELKVSYTQVMLDFMRMCRATGVWAMPDALRYLRSVVTADGLISRFAPGVDVSADLESLCERYLEREDWKRWLSPESLADWTSAASRLLAAGPELVSSIIAGEPESSRPVTLGNETRRPGNPGSTRVIPYLALALMSGGLALVHAPGASIGLNMPTAEIVAAACGATMVMINLLRRQGGP
jgi:ubiquinone biosynthesis protein